MFKINSSVKQWWWLFVIGILMVLFGSYILFFPLPAFVGISVFFAALIFASGVMHSIFSLSNRDILSGWGWYLAIGVFETLAGLALMMQPALAMTTVIIFTGFWLMFRGVMSINIGFELKKLGLKNWGWSIFWAVLTLILSFFVLINPVLGIISVVVLTGLPLLFAGVSAIMLSFVLKKLLVE